MYYLFIYPFVTLNIVDSKVLFYNTLDGRYFIFDLNKAINDILNIITIENACVTISSDLYNMKEFKIFVSKIENNNMGFIEKMSYFKVKPFSPPVFNLSSKKNEITPFNRPKYLIENLHEVTIYLNNISDTNYLNSKSISDAYKQLKYIKINNYNKKYLNLKDVLSFTKILPEKIIINILGGNIFKYRYLPKLLDKLLKYKNRIVLHIHYQDLSTINNNDIIEFIKKFYLYILIDFPINIKELNDGLQKITANNYKLAFLIENEKDLKKSENIINNMKTSSYTQIPFFNNRNLTFFKRNVYLNKNDILSEVQSVVELLIKRISNPNYFGKLILDCDGNLYSNFFSPPLASLNSFLENKDIILNNLINDIKSDWIYNKFQVNPCKNCIYNFLCTPISNYEKVIGKNNLCTIIK